MRAALLGGLLILSACATPAAPPTPFQQVQLTAESVACKVATPVTIASDLLDLLNLFLPPIPGWIAGIVKGGDGAVCSVQGKVLAS